MHFIKHQSTGGQILKIGDILYLSPYFKDSNSLSKRGGIPVLFPQFSDIGSLKKHGFARNLDWTLIHDATLEPSYPEEGVVIYQLKISSKNHPEWPNNAVLRLSCHYKQDQAFIELNVTNIGNSMFQWTGGLHPYLQIENLLETEVYGLTNAPQLNKYHPEHQTLNEISLRFSNEPYESLFNTDSSLHLMTKGRSLKLTKSGFPQWMIWNPGQEGAKTLMDLPNEDWSKFICIEPVIVTKPVVLKPQEQWTGSLKIEFSLPT